MSKNLYKNRDWLREQYMEKGLSQEDIAKKCDTYQPIISIYLKRFGLNEIKEDKTKKYTNKEWLREQYIENDRSIEDIAEEFGVSFSTIRYWILVYRLDKENKKEQVLDVMEENEFLDYEDVDIDISKSYFRRIKKESSDNFYGFNEIFIKKRRKLMEIFIDNYFQFYNNVSIGYNEFKNAFIQFMNDNIESEIKFNITNKMLNSDLKDYNEIEIYRSFSYNGNNRIKGIYFNVEGTKKFKGNITEAKRIEILKKYRNNEISREDITRKFKVEPLLETLKHKVNQFNKGKIEFQPSRRTNFKEIHIEYSEAKEILLKIMDRTKGKYISLTKIALAIYLVSPLSQKDCGKIVGVSNMSIRKLRKEIIVNIKDPILKYWKHSKSKKEKMFEEVL